ncbi:MAG: hypothetical protein AB8H79_12675, partial [Myxococcota bacterium]
MKLGMVVLGAVVFVGLGALGAWLGAPLLEWLAWVLPGVLVAPWCAWRSWTPKAGDLGRAIVVGWAPAVWVVVTTALIAGAGWAVWDPAGHGLERWWSHDVAGEEAVAVTSLGTVALVQAGLALGAPFFALPQGLGLSLWAYQVPKTVRPAILAALVGLSWSLAGPGAAIPAAAFAGAAFAWSGRTPWPAALGVAGLFGVPGLGALLADAGPGVVGWTSPIVWAGA